MVLAQLPASSLCLFYQAEHVCAAFSLSGQALLFSPPEAEEKEASVVRLWFKVRPDAACGAVCPSLARTEHFTSTERWTSYFCGISCFANTKVTTCHGFCRKAVRPCFLGSPSPPRRSSNTVKAEPVVGSGQCCNPPSNIKDLSFKISLNKTKL